MPSDGQIAWAGPRATAQKLLPRRRASTVLSIRTQETVSPLLVLTEEVPFSDIIESYKRSDRHGSGWMKVVLVVPRPRQKRKAA